MTIGNITFNIKDTLFLRKNYDYNCIEIYFKNGDSTLQQFDEVEDLDEAFNEYSTWFVE